MYDFLKGDIDYESLNNYQKILADWIENTTRYSIKTKEVYWSILNPNVNKFELELNKELKDFKREEILIVLDYVSNKSLKSIKSIYDVINLYMNHISRLENNFKNPCDGINIKEYINSKADKNKYQSLEKFYDTILDLNCSDVDKMLLVLARYGVSMDDIGYIKWEDIDKQNKILKVYNQDIILELPIDRIFMMMMDKAKECHRYAPGQKTVEYVDYGYIIKASAIVKWKNIPSNNCRNVIGNICRRNNINRLSVLELNNSRKYDLLLEIYNQNRKITIDDIEKIISIFDKEVTKGKTDTLRRNFELDFLINITK